MRAAMKRAVARRLVFIILCLEKRLLICSALGYALSKRYLPPGAWNAARTLIAFGPLVTYPDGFTWRRYRGELKKRKFMHAKVRCVGIQLRTVGIDQDFSAIKAMHIPPDVVVRGRTIDPVGIGRIDRKAFDENVPVE
jgi:hypothetical protein